MKLLIDGDSLIYAVGFLKDNGRDRSLEDSQSTLYTMFTNIMKESGCDDYLFYLTGKKSYRKEAVSSYKENRVDSPKPLYYKELRQYCVNILKAEIVEDIEADDAVSIAAKVIGYDDVIIYSRDKDVLQVPCKVLIPGNASNDYQYTLYDCRKNKLWLEKKKKKTVLKGYGRVWFYAQMVIGDSVDNVKGLPSWEIERISRDKLAYELLHNTDSSMWYKKVLGKYIDYYNTDTTPNKGLELFMENYLQLKLLEEYEGFTIKEEVNEEW